MVSYNTIITFFLNPLPQYRPSAAAAAKSLQSCPILCDPIDSSPPGSPVPGILQARTLEWVAISFSNAWKWIVKVKPLIYRLSNMLVSLSISVLSFDGRVLPGPMESIHRPRLYTRFLWSTSLSGTQDRSITVGLIININHCSQSPPLPRHMKKSSI